ncbi:MAG: hypothetical protein IRZ03_18780 [Acidobacterium ailaaui]|jgi:regulator of replication initiation timing|nr:hypothetical protein [Pseudacidobacterium ailaaui]
MLNDLNALAPLINTVLLIATSIGAFLFIRNSRRQTVIGLQSEAIDALQSQVVSLQARLESLEEENNRLRTVLDTIRAALKEQGIIITIDGEMVTITNQRAQKTHYRRTSSQRRGHQQHHQSAGDFGRSKSHASPTALDTASDTTSF